jgi:aminocarboxymuconate-semialdehyde decarboxylase
MKIDIFNHIFPRPFFDRYIANAPGGKDIVKRMKNVPVIVDLDHRFRVLDELPDVRQVITLGQPPLELLAGPDETPAIARMANDGLAELVERHPDRFVAFGASLPLNNPEASVAEVVRASEQLGARGALIYTNVAGKPLDAPEFEPLFAEMARRDLVVMLHPARGSGFADYASEQKSRYEIWWALGWPYETSAAMARLVFSGLFDRHPQIKVLAHHMGGMIPFFEGRVGYGWDQLGVRTSHEDLGAVRSRMRMRPIDCFKQFHADCALFGAAAATRCGLEFFGAERVLFASDMPFDPTPGLYLRETIRAVESLDLSPADKERIYRTNAERLLNLKTADAA